MNSGGGRVPWAWGARMDWDPRNLFMRTLLLLVAMALMGCPDEPAPTPTDDDDSTPVADDDDATGTVEDPVYSGAWDMPTWDVFDDLPFPTDDDGNYVVLQTPEVALKLDPDLRDAVTSAAGCATLVVSCFEDGVRNIPGCLANVPTCESDTPWDDASNLCCAPGCADRYAELRVAGNAEPQAFVGAVWETPSCMPGLDALVGVPK